jgi:hypothetical protein
LLDSKGWIDLGDSSYGGGRDSVDLLNPLYDDAGGCPDLLCSLYDGSRGGLTWGTTREEGPA